MSPQIPRGLGRAGRGGAAARKKANPVTVGAIGVAVILAFCYWAFAKRIPFVEGFEVKAVVHSTNQLRKGSPVRIAGVDVGKVTSVEPVDEATGGARVKMEIQDKGLPIHEDAEL